MSTDNQVVNMEQPYKDAMVDIETLGTTPGSTIISIGAVSFDRATGNLGPQLYQIISRADSALHGFTENPETLKWWSEQSQDAKMVLMHCVDPAAGRVAGVLKTFAEYLDLLGPKTRVWANDPDFDLVLIGTYYQVLGLKRPWAYHNARSYRTLKDIAVSLGSTSLPRAGTHHNAVDDARHQAQNVIKWLHDLQALKSSKRTLS